MAGFDLDFCVCSVTSLVLLRLVPCVFVECHVQWCVLFQTLQSPMVNVVTSSSVLTGVVGDSSKSVIDLTDDDDASAAVTRSLVQAPPPPQLYLIAAPTTQSLAVAPTLTSTAIVKPTMRPVPPPPLQMAPNQPTRFQVRTTVMSWNEHWHTQHINFHCVMAAWVTSLRWLVIVCCWWFQTSIPYLSLLLVGAFQKHIVSKCCCQVGLGSVLRCLASRLYRPVFKLRMVWSCGVHYTRVKIFYELFHHTTIIRSTQRPNKARLSVCPSTKS